jgi:hypothetical protein
LPAHFRLGANQRQSPGGRGRGVVPQAGEAAIFQIANGETMVWAAQFSKATRVSKIHVVGDGLDTATADELAEPIEVNWRQLDYMNL